MAVFELLRIWLMGKMAFAMTFLGKLPSGCSNYKWQCIEHVPILSVWSDAYPVQ